MGLGTLCVLYVLLMLPSALPARGDAQTNRKAGIKVKEATKPAEFSLQGQLLAAMPNLLDHRFRHSVIFMCAHNAEGAMGLVVNRPAPQLSFSELLEQLKVEAPLITRNYPVYIGGPVESGRGFVLHTTDYETRGTMKMEVLNMTASVDILQDIARNKGPKRFLPALGYSGWSPGKLEAEIQENSWLTFDYDEEIVFGRDSDSKWQRTMGSLGIDPVMLSGIAGRA